MNLQESYEIHIGTPRQVEWVQNEQSCSPKIPKISCKCPPDVMKKAPLLMPRNSSHAAPIPNCLVSSKREKNRLLGAYGIYTAIKCEPRQTVKGEFECEHKFSFLRLS